MADMLKRYAERLPKLAENPALPDTIRRRITGNEIRPVDDGAHVAQKLDAAGDSRNWLMQTADSVGQLQDGLPDLAMGLGNLIAGDKDAAVRRLGNYQANLDKAKALGPAAQDFEDIEDFGSGASVIGYQFAKMVPDMMLGGIGGLAGKQAVKLGAKKLLTGMTARELAGNAGIQSLKEGASDKAVRELAKTAAYKELGNRTAERTAKKEARALAEGTFERQIQTTAGKLAAGNPVLKPLSNAGFAVGATAGSIPSNLQDQGQFLAENADSMSQGDAWKLLAGTTAAASTDFLPLMGFMGRFSKQGVDAARASDAFGKRLLKATGKQFLAEGSQEAAQAFITRSSQKWVDENVELLSDEALADYGMNFIAGGIMGGVMGFAGETGTTTARKIGDAFRSTYTALEKRRIERETARAAGADPNAPPADPSINPSAPTESSKNAAAAAAQSGRTINPIAAKALDAPGDDFQTQLSFSKKVDSSVMDITDRAERYAVGDVGAIIPIGADVRRLTPGDAFARIAGGVALTGTQDIQDTPEMRAGLKSLGLAFKHGFDSDLVTDEDRTRIEDLQDYVAEPDRVSQLLSMRAERPTDYAAALAGIDAQIAAQEDAEQAAAERGTGAPGQLNVFATDSGRTAPADSDRGAPNILGPAGEFFTGKGIQTEKQALAGNTAGNTADGEAATFKGARPSAVLLRPEYQPALQAFLTGLGPAQRAAAGKAYTDLMEAAQKVGELSTELPVFRQPAEEALAKIEARPDVQRLMQRLGETVTGAADRVAAAKTNAIFPAQGDGGAMRARVKDSFAKTAERKFKSLYAASRDGKHAVDIGTLHNNLKRTDDMAEANKPHERAAAVVAHLLTNTALNVDPSAVPWGKVITFGNGETLRIPMQKDQRFLEWIAENNAPAYEKLKAKVQGFERGGQVPAPYTITAAEIARDAEKDEASGDELKLVESFSLANDPLTENSGLVQGEGTLQSTLAVKAQKLAREVETARAMGWDVVQKQLEKIGAASATMIRRAPKDGKNFVQFLSRGVPMPGFAGMTYEKLMKRAPILLDPNRPAEFIAKDDKSKFVKEIDIPTDKDIHEFVRTALKARVDGQLSERAANIEARKIDAMAADALMAEFEQIKTGKYATMSRVEETRSQDVKNFDNGATEYRDDKYTEPEETAAEIAERKAKVADAIPAHRKKGNRAKLVKPELSRGAAPKKDEVEYDSTSEPSEVADALIARRRELARAKKENARKKIQAQIEKLEGIMDASNEKIVPRIAVSKNYDPKPRDSNARPKAPSRDRVLDGAKPKTRITPRERAAMLKAGVLTHGPKPEPVSPAAPETPARTVNVTAAPQRTKSTEKRMAARRVRTDAKQQERKGEAFINEVLDSLKFSVATAPNSTVVAPGTNEKGRAAGKVRQALGAKTTNALFKSGLLDVRTKQEALADHKISDPSIFDSVQAYAYAGKVTFVAEETARLDSDTINGVIAHEAVHGWTARLLGPKAYTELVERVFMDSAKAFREFMDANPDVKTYSELAAIAGWKTVAFARTLSVTDRNEPRSKQAADEVLAYHLSETAAKRARDNEAATPLQRAARRAANRIKLALLKVSDATGAMKTARDALLEDGDFLAFVAEEAVFQMGLEAERIAALPATERAKARDTIREQAFSASLKLPWFNFHELHAIAEATVEDPTHAKTLYALAKRMPSTASYSKAIPAERTTKKLVDMNLEDFSEYTDAHLNDRQRQAVYDLVHSVGGFGKSIRDADSLTLSAEHGFHKTMHVALGEYLAGNLKADPNTKEFFDYFDRLKKRMGVFTTNDLALKILQDMKSGKLEETINARLPYQPELDMETKRTGIGSLVTELQKARHALLRMYSDFIKNEYDQAKNSGIPAWFDLLNAIQPRSGHRLVINEKTGVAHDGVVSVMAHETGRWLKKLTAASEGLSAAQETRVLRELYYNLENPRPKTLNGLEVEAFHKIRAVYKEMAAYGVEAGMFKGEKGSSRVRSNFTPVIFDIGGNAELHKAKLKNMFYQLDADGEYKYAKLFSDLQDALNADKPEKDTMAFAQMGKEAKLRFIDRMVDNAFFDATDLIMENQMGKRFKFDAPRVWQEVYNRAKKDADYTDLDTLVSTLEPSLVEHGVRYVEPLVSKAEENRYFPDGVKPFVQDMVRQGATPEQVNKAVRAYDNTFGRFTFATLGPNGEKGSPTIAALSPALAKKMHSRKTLRTMQNIGAWQNLRLLPLAVLNSLVDPAGIIVRNGGDLTAGIQAFKSALSAMWSEETREALLAGANDIGYAAELEAAAALDANAGTGSRTPLSRIVNSAIFKWNGMQALTKYTRLVAIQAGHAFLVRQQNAARGTDAKAKANAIRYFEELGIKVDDVRVGTVKAGPLAGQPTVLLLTPQQVLSANKGQREADARVKAALIKFTDEAILRPSGLQTPGWHNDPYVKLITQYKAFTYAIYEQITRRISTEIDNGNYAVLNAALAYLPIGILAALLREFIQYGPDGDPKRANWGGAEYLGLATVKTGLLGPGAEFTTSVGGDAQRGNMPGSSYLGPTVGTARDIGNSATGDRAWGTTLESMLPASALWKRWNDDNQQGRGVQRGRGAVDKVLAVKENASDLARQ